MSVAELFWRFCRGQAYQMRPAEQLMKADGCGLTGLTPDFPALLQHR